MNTTELMFNAIKSQFPWADCPLADAEEISADLISEAYNIAVKQDLGHLVASACEKIADESTKKEFSKKKLTAIFRREQISFEEKKIFNLFDTNEIDYIPLKGSVIKKFYPEEWMRTSSDTDILIRPENGERALSLLTEALGYKYEGKSAKDYQLFSENGVHIELHYSPESGNPKTDKVLSQIWDYAVKGENTHRYDLTPEFLLFYTVAHALYHFLGGGCGVKPFLDVWVMESKMEYDINKLSALINECGIEKFYISFKALSEVWFGKAEHTDITRNMEDYIFMGGVYGNRENLGKASLHKNGSKLKYLYSRIFKPRKYLELQYPNLENHPMLLPYYQIKRWFNLFNGNRRRDVTAELQGSLKNDETAKLFDILEI
ncbi:MAG: hypothetical protein E7586_00985 [Ruminococcaceae bacterium]|nr:hypothetical protein [Oscillospiraceae bacterium]